MNHPDEAAATEPTPDTAESVQADAESEDSLLQAILDTPSERIEGFLSDDGFVVQITFPWDTITDVRTPKASQ